jgi:hypothetical protein
MDELALRTLVTNLQASRSSDHWWLEVCTALVAVGVLFEVIFVIWEYVDELHDFRRGIVHPPERPNIILFALGLFGAGLVAIGVAGEFRFEAKIESTETRIRKANDDLFLLLSKTGDAATSAKTARNEADAAVKSASDALTIANGARLESDAVAKLAGKAEGKAEKVGKRAEAISARLDMTSQQLSQVEQRVRVQGPRWQLLEDNKAEFIESMKPFRGSMATVRCGLMASPEQIKVEYDLLVFFGKDGAAWKTTNMVWPKCPEYGFSGFLLIWSESATTESK